jgi:hypothetical protein
MTYEDRDWTLRRMRPTIKDKTVRLDEDGQLLCPCGCNSIYLHQIAYTIYERPSGEDGLTIAIDVANIDSIIHSVSRRNPSERRQGLAILFECEHCDGFIELTIQQTKGNTYLEWRDTSLEQMRKYVTKEKLDQYRELHNIKDITNLFMAKG